MKLLTAVKDPSEVKSALDALAKAAQVVLASTSQYQEFVASHDTGSKGHFTLAEFSKCLTSMKGLVLKPEDVSLLSTLADPDSVQQVEYKRFFDFVAQQAVFDQIQSAVDEDEF